jgi:hypothetical protein
LIKTIYFSFKELHFLLFSCATRNSQYLKDYLRRVKINFSSKITEFHLESLSHQCQFVSKSLNNNRKEKEIVKTSEGDRLVKQRESIVRTFFTQPAYFDRLVTRLDETLSMEN